MSLPGPRRSRQTTHRLSRRSLLVQDDGEQGFVDLDFAVVFDEAQFPEFVHEEIDAGTSGADHAGQGFLGHPRQDAVGLFLFALAREEHRVRARRFSLELKS